MKEEIMLHALEEIRDEHLLEAALYVSVPKAPRRTKRLVRVLLIAAVLTTLFSVTAFAVWQGVFRARVPEPDEEITFHVLNSDFNDTHGQLIPRKFQHVGMLVTVDGAEEGHWVLLRDRWLPESVATSERLVRSSFYDTMDFFSDHSMYVGWRQRPLEQLLEEAQLSAGEAKNWYTGIRCEMPHLGPLFDLTVYDATTLYARPLLFGAAEWATAQIVREGTLGSYQLLEVQVRYSAIERAGKTIPADVQNHVLLYEPTEKYLIRISGSDSAYDFETLEKIGENLEVLVTDFETQLPEMASDYLYCDLGRG